MESTDNQVSGGARPTACLARAKAVLVVDDEPEVKNLIVRVLAAHQYPVFAAGSYREARDCFSREGARIGVLVADVMLGDGNGVLLAEELQQANPGLRVLLISGRMDEAWGASIQSNGYGFLRKPFELHVLLGQVQRLLG